MKSNLITIMVITIVVTTLFSCHKQDSNKPSSTILTNAVITGVDYRKCACCGGLMITFTEDTVPYSATFYDIKDLPANAGITERSIFPMKVKVAYKKLNEACGNFVSITAIQKR